MSSAFLVRLRPVGPCRFGPEDGSRARTSSIGRSDTFYAALSAAFEQLGWKEDWIGATAATADPSVRVSSLFPMLGRLLYVAPPQSLWPPDASPRLRWKAASLVPTTVVQDLALRKPLREERWEVDTASECLIPAGGLPPFRVNVRRLAAVDRVGAAVEPHQTACLEFNNNAGFWAAVLFASEESLETWGSRIRAALKILADSGLGGERGIGWGHFETPEIQQGAFPDMLMPEWRGLPVSEAQWLLSVFNPASSDSVDWSAGRWAVDNRSRADSQTVKMVKEGSVLSAPAPLTGRAVDLARPDRGRPLWRSGFAVAIPLPVPPVEETPA